MTLFWPKDKNCRTEQTSKTWQHIWSEGRVYRVSVHVHVCARLHVYVFKEECAAECTCGGRKSTLRCCPPWLLPGCLACELSRECSGSASHVSTEHWEYRQVLSCPAVRGSCGSAPSSSHLCAPSSSPPDPRPHTQSFTLPRSLSLLSPKPGDLVMPRPLWGKNDFEQLHLSPAYIVSYISCYSGWVLHADRGCQ